MIIPRYISVKDWFASLIIDFPADNIPILSNESDWKLIGNAIIQEHSFSTAGAPGTDSYSDPYEWMKDVFYTMANN